MHPIRRPPRRGFGEQPATLAAIQNLFARGEQGGYWPADPAYAYEDSAGTIPASRDGVVGLLTNAVTGYPNAIQATTANKPYLRRTPATGKTWYDSNTATGALNVTFASALGSSCTIATVTPEGVSILENKTVGTTYNICPPYGYNSDVLIINRALTPAEKALVTRVMQRDIPAYGSLVNAIPQMRGYSANNEMQIDWSTKTSFIDYWRYGGNYLSSFPLINTAAGTDFSFAWYGCSGLTSFPLINTAAGTNFSAAWYECSSLTSFPLINTAAGTNFSVAWAYCSGLTSFPLINTAAGTSFYGAWYGCSGLTSFPLINTAAGTDFSYAWYNCSSLTSFPLINTEAGTSFYQAWNGCSGLTSFPLINTAAGTSFDAAWSTCSNLTSFPLINTAAGTSFYGAWYNCSSLTSFPANFFDSWTGVPIANCFSLTWDSCIKLTLASVQNIVVSLVVSGKSAPATGTDISLDGAPTLVAIQADTTVMTAVATLKSRNWTPKYKGTAL